MMATQPPPDSPKDAYRAQRDAARARRHYWRMQQRPSIIGPLLLIAIGVVALLIEIGKLSAFGFWDWYVRWWPLLLIVVGLISLGEWWLDRESPYGRRHRYGGVIVLLILLAVVGYSDHGLRRLNMFQNQGDDDDLLFHFLGHQHESDQTLNQAIPSGALIDIQVPHGDVTVTPSGDAQIHVQAHEVAYANSDGDARRSFARLRPQLTVSGQSVTLRSGNRGSDRADLIIEIPADAQASISAGHGDVTVEDLNTPLKLNAGKGDVKLNNLKGTLDARMGDGDFTAHSLAGDVSLRGRLEDVAITDIQGRTLLDGEFFGDTHIAQVTGQVHVHSSRTAVDLDSLPGDLLLDSDDLQINNATGPVIINTRAKDIECTDIAGDVHVEDANGDISLGVKGQPGGIQLGNRNGAVQLTLPHDASFVLRATASTGDIETDFGLPVETSGRGHTVSGTVGSGAANIELTADHGDIRLNRADALATTTEPASPGKTMRHLRPPPGGVPPIHNE
jgi:DUF4097 and DUF4098 domain-containing protein YvlB